MTIDLGTELAPAISLAYEDIEENIMTIPPRKRSVRLVSKGLLAYSYLFAGHVMAITGCAGYLYTFWFVNFALL